MKVLMFVIGATLMVALVQGASVEFNYDDQSTWVNFHGSHCAGSRQSPINIDTSATTRAGSDFSAIQFENYNFPSYINGIFQNLATTVELVPNHDDKYSKDAYITNKFGRYVLKQFHFHWGRNNQEGSEHTVNGKQYAAEIHFVHEKVGASGSTAGDTYSVLGVLLEAADIPVRGFWNILSPVPRRYGEKRDSRYLVLEDMLPENKDYYHYEGSLTTPLCNEIVQWFVFKEPIQIPNRFLANLRRVQRDREGTHLTHNFRYTQPLNGRTVTEYDSSSRVVQPLKDRINKGRGRDEFENEEDRSDESDNSESSESESDSD